MPECTQKLQGLRKMVLVSGCMISAAHTEPCSLRPLPAAATVLCTAIASNTGKRSTELGNECFMKSRRWCGRKKAREGKDEARKI